MTRSKFCFFGNISGALTGNTVGGGELQVALLAKALALKGHEVVIIDPYAKESFTSPEGVKLIKIENWNKGIRGVRFILHRVPALYKILDEQNADYYYIRMRSFFHLIPYLVAKKNKAIFIQAIASDIDVIGFWNQIKYEIRTNSNIFKLFMVNVPSYIVSNYLLLKSDYIFLQHKGQIMTGNHIKGKMMIFPNIIENKVNQLLKSFHQDYFIHVGTLTIYKGAENLYNLISILDKNIKVIIVGVPDDNKSEIIFNRLKDFSNVILKGRMDHQSTIQLIANAQALINTSNYEGFPNIFLEAWASGVPVISLKVNPGNVLNQNSLGICCEGDLNRMKNCIETYETISIDHSKLISYVNDYHDFDSAIDRLASIIQ